MKYKIDVVPMGAVRMTRRGKFVNKAAQRYLSYKEVIGLSLRNEAPKTKISEPVMVEVLFNMPIPQSWSKKKQRETTGAIHTKKPDIDNLVKGLFDACNNIIWEDDNQVYEVTARKVYSDKPSIMMEVLTYGQAEQQKEEKAE